MSSVQVECWNCGLKFNVVIEKLATARCGNCQQTIAKEDQQEAGAVFVSQTPEPASNETPAIEIRPVEQRQEEKNFPATNEPRAESSQIPRLANSARTITQKELLLGLGLSVVVALIVKVLSAYVFTYWVNDFPAAYIGNEEAIKLFRQRRFLSSFNFSNVITLLGVVRHVLTYFLFFFLSLSQRVSRARAYAIAALVGVLLFVANTVADFMIRLAESFTLIQVLNFNRWTYLLVLFFIGVGLVIMDFLIRWLFRGRAFAGVMNDNSRLQPAILEAREEAK